MIPIPEKRKVGSSTLPLTTSFRLVSSTLTRENANWALSCPQLSTDHDFPCVTVVGRSLSHADRTSRLRVLASGHLHHRRGDRWPNHRGHGILRMVTKRAQVGERRWPMAAAVFVAGGLRIFLPSQLRLDDARPLLVVVLAVLMGALIVGDPGRIDRKKTWLRVLTGVLIGVITVVNAGASVRLVYAIVQTEPFTNDANILLVSGGIIWLTNMIAFGLWYWDLDRGGAAARALGTGTSPAFVFPEMSNPELVRDGWYPSFVDYLHLSFSTSMAFSPTDVSAIKPWAKLMMMAEEAISVVVGILVVARAVNILK
ncbi:MAG: hypothetical protein WAK76_22500 [Trebonia sp.]